MLDKGTFLDFKDDASCLQALYVMPGVFRDVNAKNAVFMTEDCAFKYFALVIVCVYANSTFQHNECLVLGHMVMDWDFRSDF
jgi:hypothetical protein